MNEEKIVQIWKEKGFDIRKDNFLTPEDFSAIRNPVSKVPWSLFGYGNHCGPATRHPESPAIDALDFSCKCHDRYFSNRKSDSALMDSSKFIMQNGIVETDGAMSYLKKVDSKKFLFLSNCFRFRRGVALLIICWILSGFLLFRICKNNKINRPTNISSRY